MCMTLIKTALKYTEQNLTKMKRDREIHKYRDFRKYTSVIDRVSM